MKVARAREVTAQRGSNRQHRRTRLWVNWSLALLTAVGSPIVMVYAIGAVMSTAACSDVTCPSIGPSGISWSVVFYGAPVIAAVTILVSFFTASRRWGILVPLVGWALLLADIALLSATVWE